MGQKSITSRISLEIHNLSQMLAHICLYLIL